MKFPFSKRELPHLLNTGKREFWWCSSKRFYSLTLLHWIRHGDLPRWTGDETGLTSQLISTPSLPTQRMKGSTTPPGSMPPTLYEQVEQQCGFFQVPQESEQWKSCETGPTVFRPYPRRLQYLTICRCLSKGSTFFSVTLRPWVLVRLEFEPATSRSADRRLSNWATRAAVRKTIKILRQWYTQKQSNNMWMKCPTP